MADRILSVNIAEAVTAEEFSLKPDCFLESRLLSQRYEYSCICTAFSSSLLIVGSTDIGL